MPNEITVEQRMAAASRVAGILDKAVRKESVYGEKNAAGFDEMMALTGVAHALATWCSDCTEEQLRERLQTVLMATKALWHDQQATRQPTETIN